MKFFFYLVMLVSLMISTGCQTANSNAQSTEIKTGGPTKYDSQYGGLKPSVDLKQRGENLSLHFSVRNQSDKPIILHFNTTQRFDYSLTEVGKGEIDRYSKGRMFGQMVTALEFKKGDVLNYSSTINGIKPGHYQLSIWLTDQTYRPNVTVSFTIK